MNDRTLIPRDGGALAAVSELKQLFISRSNVAERFREFIDIGAPLFRAYVDWGSAIGAGDLLVTYEASDCFHAFLMAARAGDGQFDDAFKIARHSASLSAPKSPSTACASVA